MKNVRPWRTELCCKGYVCWKAEVWIQTPVCTCSCVWKRKGRRERKEERRERETFWKLWWITNESLSCEGSSFYAIKTKFWESPFCPKRGYGLRSLSNCAKRAHWSVTFFPRLWFFQGQDCRLFESRSCLPRTCVSSPSTVLCCVGGILLILLCNTGFT